MLWQPSALCYSTQTFALAQCVERCNYATANTVCTNLVWGRNNVTVLNAHEYAVEISLKILPSSNSTRLNVKNAVYTWWVLRLQQCDGNVVYGNPAGRSAVAFSIVSMAMDDQVGAVAVNDFSQP